MPKELNGPPSVGPKPKNAKTANARMAIVMINLPAISNLPDLSSALGRLVRHSDRDLVEVHGILEDEPVERVCAERRLGRRMALGLRVRPRAVETGEVAGPQEIAEADFRHAAEPAFFLDLEGERDLPFDKLTRLV